jgi:SNF2 family DNA or RNA helicase
MSSSRLRLWNYLHNLHNNELNSSSEIAEQPEKIKQKLLPHQQTSLAAALKLEESKIIGLSCTPQINEISLNSLDNSGKLYTNYGILCDRVGSGKSLTALAIASSPSPSSFYTEFINRNNLGSGSDITLVRNSDFYTKPDGTSYTKVNASLFIVPHSVVHQWESYLQNDTTLRYVIIKKGKDATTPLGDKINNTDVVVVSSTMWRAFELANPLVDYVWNRIFIDEADSIQFSSYGDLSYLKACFYWLISASWMNFAFPNGAYINISASYPPPDSIPTTTVEKIRKLFVNSSHTIYIDGLRRSNIVRTLCGYNNVSMIHLNSVVLQSFRLFIKNSDDFINHSFTFPDIRHYSIVCETPASLFVLDKSLNPEILERLHAGDLDGAYESLGVKPSSVSSINEALTQSLHKELDQSKKIYEFKKTIEYSSNDAKVKSLEACEKKIASLESRISSIEDRLKNPSSSNCPICFCDVSNPSLTPCCQNLFCFPCICESLSRSSTCPLCRATIENVKSIHIVGSDEKHSDSESTELTKPITKKLSKNESIVKFIKSNPDAKILMFSGFDATFNHLSSLLKSEKISFANVQGSNAHINKLIKDFENNKYNVLFLNARNMGAGLNILCASHIILYHRMNQDLEKQIIGRAHRIGRTKTLEVIHLLHTNEVDNTYSKIEASSVIGSISTTSSSTIEHV